MNQNIYKLYLVTDRTWLGANSLEYDVEQAILGGVTLVQLREKNCSIEEFIERANSIKTICDRHNVPLIINDNIEVAIAVNASGVHLGQDDTNINVARQQLGLNKIIGVSARTVEQALYAEARGADYLGVGAIFGTATKNNAKPLDIATLTRIASSVSIPIVAIGGVTLTNVNLLANTNIHGVAVISTILSAIDKKSTSSQLLKSINSIVK